MTAVIALMFLILGFLAGALHFTLLRRNADLFVSGGSPLAAIGLQLGRMATTAGVLLIAALNGWVSLLAATAGLMAARQVVVRRLGRPAP